MQHIQVTNVTIQISHASLHPLLAGRLKHLPQPPTFSVFPYPQNHPSIHISLLHVFKFPLSLCNFPPPLFPTGSSRHNPPMMQRLCADHMPWDAWNGIRGVNSRLLVILFDVCSANPWRRKRRGDMRPRHKACGSDFKAWPLYVFAMTGTINMHGLWVSMRKLPLHQNYLALHDESIYSQTSFLS